MLIAQLTDIHIGFERDAKPEEFNRIRFRAALARLVEGPNRPDLLVLSGDITEHGDLDSFERTAEIVAELPFPVLPMVGNHDKRETLLQAFPATPSEGGFVHYALEREGLLVLLLDTLDEGRHGGAFCPARQQWLSAQLAAHPATPTVIFMHHPPARSGIEWMDPEPDEDWIRRFAETVAGQRQVKAIHCGHLHRTLATSLHGIPLCVTPSIAPQVTFDLAPIAPDAPDDRAMIVAEPPVIAWHYWDGAHLATHYEPVGDWRVLARYGPMLQDMVREMLAERR